MVWLCNQEPVRTLQKGPPPEKAVTGLYFSKQARTQTPEIITSQLVPKLAYPFVRGHVISK